jgi:hypothetical protein
MTGQLYDAPNQQVVRADGSGPADQGTGGSAPEPQPTGLDAMTKQELLDHARELGVSPANNDMTKEELRAAIDAHQAAG